jgi:hypothetical protein
MRMTVFPGLPEAMVPLRRRVAMLPVMAAAGKSMTAHNRALLAR